MRLPVDALVHDISGPYAAIPFHFSRVKPIELRRTHEVLSVYSYRASKFHTGLRVLSAGENVVIIGSVLSVRETLGYCVYCRT